MSTVYALKVINILGKVKVVTITFNEPEASHISSFKTELNNRLKVNKADFGVFNIQHFPGRHDFSVFFAHTCSVSSIDRQLEAVASSMGLPIKINRNPS